VSRLFPYVFRKERCDIIRIRLPHSEISGSTRICRSPKLIAAYHVLHRLLAPRHSLCALYNLISPALLKPAKPILNVRRNSPRYHFPRVLMSQSVPRDGYLILYLFLYYPICSCQRTGNPSGHILPDLACFNCVSPALFPAPSQMVDPVGLEPTTPALSRRCSNQLSYGSMIWVMDRAFSGCDRLFEVVPSPPKSGGMGIRTPDIQLAKLALYQLSYTPMI
jgi:hypothetical protein